MRRVGMVIIDPNTARLYGTGNLIEFMCVSRPYTGSKSIKGVIGYLDSFFGGFKGRNARNRAEDFLLENAHFVMAFK